MWPAGFFHYTTLRPHAGTLGHINASFLFESAQACVSTPRQTQEASPCAHTMSVTLSLSLLDSVENITYCPDCIYSFGNDLWTDTGRRPARQTSVSDKKHAVTSQTTPKQRETFTQLYKGMLCGGYSTGSLRAHMVLSGKRTPMGHFYTCCGVLFTLEFRQKAKEETNLIY